jgi:hypothetical protein
MLRVKSKEWKRLLHTYLNPFNSFYSFSIRKILYGFIHLKLIEMKKEKKHLTILLLANGILLLSVITTKAQQQDSTKQVNLKDVTITASRSEKAPLDAGRSISVITGEEIKNSGVNTISEVLSLQEGIYIVGNTSPGQLQSILYSIWNTMKYMAIAPVAEGFI